MWICHKHLDHLTCIINAHTVCRRLFCVSMCFILPASRSLDDAVRILSESMDALPTVPAVSVFNTVSQSLCTTEDTFVVCCHTGSCIGV